MDVVLAVVFAVALWVGLPFLLIRGAIRRRRQMRDMVAKVEGLRSELDDTRRQVALLQNRVATVEGLPREAVLAGPLIVDAAPVVTPPPVLASTQAVVPLPPPVPEPTVEPLPAQVEVSIDEPVGVFVEGTTAATSPAALQVVERPAPTVAAHVEPRKTDERANVEVRRPAAFARLNNGELETLIGGNWLNKVGVAVFVIGLSLFLGYSLTRLGPAGRVATAWTISVALMAIGVVLSKRPMYRLFGLGLLGGGWAGAYFTAFAMYALPAARVIDNPLAASLFLVVVASAMIAHGMTFRSMTLSALTYAIGFATLNIAPSGGFTVFASIPLAASLVAVAYRLRWTALGALGMLLAYGSFLFRMVVATNPATVRDLLLAQSMVTVYWLMFEAFDIADVRRERFRRGIGQALFTLNTTGYFGISLLLWVDRDESSLFFVLGVAALTYLISAVVRARLVPQERESAPEDALLSGGYEGAITIAASLAAAAFIIRLRGVVEPAALLVEGQLLAMVGLRLRSNYLRGLASVVLLGSTVALGRVMIPEASEGAFLQLTVKWHTWVPMALVTTGVLYANFGVFRREGMFGGETFYATAATILALGVVARQTPLPWLGPAWVAVALLLTVSAQRLGALELRRHAYMAAALGVVMGLQPSGDTTWVHRAVLAGAMWLMAVSFWRWPADADHRERFLSRQNASWAATLVSTVAIFQALPEQYEALALLALAWTLVEVGRARWTEGVFQGAAVGAVSVLNIIVATELGARGTIAPVPLLAAASVLFLMSAVRFASLRKQDGLTERLIPGASVVAATVLLMLLAWHALPTAAVALAWGATALIAVELGAATSWPLVVRSGYAMAFLTFARLCVGNFAGFDDVLGISTRVLTVTPSIGLVYFLAWRARTALAAHTSTRHVDTVVRSLLWMAAFLVVALVRFEFGRVFASVGWSLAAVALLAIGHAARNIDFRIQSYVLGALAFVRGWTTNFQSPESGGLSAEILGATVVAAAFYGAEFVARRAKRQVSDGRPHASWYSTIDRYAPEAFSVGATVLLASVMLHDASASLLTVAWALLGLALLVAGFVTREAILRRSGLVLLGICIVKVLAYDSRQLETLARIVSFILLGLVLMLVSFIYTRFSGTVRKYL